MAYNGELVQVLSLQALERLSQRPLGRRLVQHRHVVELGAGLGHCNRGALARALGRLRKWPNSELKSCGIKENDEAPACPS